MTTKSLNIKDLARRATMALLFALVTTTQAWAQGWWSPHWDDLIEIISGGSRTTFSETGMTREECYRNHRPMGCVENVEILHGLISVSGWAVDLDGDHKTTATIVLRQGEGDKYSFTTDINTNSFRFNIEGNSNYRGFFGFHGTWQVVPGTYELYAFANNKVAELGPTEPISRLSIGFQEQGYSGLAWNQGAMLGNETFYHKTITVLPYQYHVTFDINYEGGVNPATIGVPDNTVVTLPFPTQTREGYTFVCWSKSNVLNESAHVYAHWIKGKGTADDPFLVENLDDWNKLYLLCLNSTATAHTELNTYSVVKLMSDLTVTRQLDKFSGEFDGGGHTITFNSDQSLFGNVSEAWIHDLKVQGTITCTPQAKYLGGLAKEFSGRGFHNTYNSIIENVEVSVDFDADNTNASTVGGFIGIGRSGVFQNILMKNCVYNGRLPRRGKVGGGFVGYTVPNNASIEFQNCLFAPKEMANKPNYTFSSHYNTFSGVYYNASNGMYYTESGENGQGEPVLTDLPATGVYTYVNIMGKECLVPQDVVSITSDNTYYSYTGSPITGITYTVSRDGTPLSTDDYTSVFRNEAGNIVESLQDVGAYRHEVTIGDQTYLRTIFVTSPLTQSDGVYQINNVADWMTFAADVAAGNTYSGSTVRLNADITTSAMVGTENHPFGGTFDGNGHTLTFNYQSALTVYDPTENCRAPFRYINGATIRNLTVAGTTISSGRQMGGLVASAAGNNHITNSTVAASLISYLGGDASNGGFIAHVQDGSTDFSGCVFTGYMLGTHAHSNGGFVGWSGGSLNFNDCLFNPIYVNMMDEGSSTFARTNYSSFTNTYYTTALGELQGTQAYSTPQSSLCDKLTMANGSVIYMVHSSAIEELSDTYAYNDGNDVTIDAASVKYNGATLSDDKYTVSIRNSAGEVVSAPTAIGRYTLTATGNSSEGYYGAVSKDFWVIKTLATDASGFYQIADEDDWRSLDYYIQNTAICKAKLTANIGTAEAPITTMLTTEDHHFNGVIDGGGHTLTVNLTGTGMAAPFLYVGNATFVNLNVAGTIRATNEGAFMGGIVALQLGNQNFVSCRSSVNIGCSYLGCAGGFVGYAATGSDHDIKFRDCLFDGVLSGRIEYSAGFVGYHYTEWPTTTLTLTNCLVNATTNNSMGTVNIFSPFYSYPSNTNQEYYVAENSYHKFETVPACYTFIDDQGSFTALAGSELQALLGDGWTVDGSDEVVPQSDALYTMNITVANDIAHGTVDCQATGVPGYPVNLTLTPEGGYLITSVSYNDGSDHIITPQDGSYSFIMPDADVTISATFSLSPTAVSYIAYNTTTDTYDSRRVAAATDVTAETEAMGISEQETWYVVNSNVTASNRIYVNGTVNLILADGATLTAAKGINVHSGDSLIVYGQEGGTGTLNATGSQFMSGQNWESAAIGSDGNGNGDVRAYLGDLIFHSGVVNATAYENTSAIGGGHYNPACGSITLYGGTITATATEAGLYGQEAIGHGAGGGNVGKTIIDGLRVYTNYSTSPTLMEYAYRIQNGLSQKDVRVERCTEHNYQGGRCTYCGAYEYHQITYNGNGNTGGTVPTVATCNVTTGIHTATATIADAGTLERTGYTFEGWNTEADGSGTAYAPDETITLNSSITLYAQWNIITYLIVYDLGGGTLPEGKSNPVEYTIEDGNIFLVNPTCEGRFFKGWSGTGIDATATNVTIPHGSTGDRYYTAMWDDNNPPFEGMEIDHDCLASQLERFFVKMPVPVEYTDYIVVGQTLHGGNIVEEHTIPAEENPKIVNIPAGFTTSFKVYDDGGKDYCAQSYPDESYLTTLILNAPEGKAFSVQGVLDIGTWYEDIDWLKIYDGADTYNEIQYVYNRDEMGSSVTSFVTSANSIRFDLHIQDGQYHSNMDLTVTVIDAPTAITLANNDSQSEQTNNSLITSNDGKFANVTLAGRTLYKDGTWNTISLPFDIDDISKTPLKGAAVKTLSTTSYNNGTLTLNFSDNLTALEAGKPYIVKWTPREYFSIIDPEYEVVTALNFISEVPEVDRGQKSYWGDNGSENYDKLVDGETNTKYGISDDDPDSDVAPYVEFHYANAFVPKGYALWTANDQEGARNPRSWTISAKNEEGDEVWTPLVTVDNEDGDKLPMANNTCTIFPLDNSTAYKYFRFEASLASNDEFQLAELQFCTVQPDESMLNIVNPTFRKVTIKNELHPMISSEALFAGHFGIMGHIDGVMLDEHDSVGDAMHSVLSVVEPTAPTGYTFEGWCTDAGLTTLANTIPFNATTGNVTLYAKITENLLALANAADNSDDIQKAATNGGEFKATLAGRTFYKDGNWNTLCLPFPLSEEQVAASDLAGATIMELDATGTYTDDKGDHKTGFDAASGTLYLYFKTATSIETGKPYIVKWTSGSNITDPVFPGVTVTSTPAGTVEAKNSGLNTVQFIGTYSPTSLTPNDKSNLFLGAGSTLYYPNDANNGDGQYYVNACRAYIHVDLEGSAGVRQFVLKFGEDNVTTGVTTPLSPWRGAGGEAEWYTLDGRKLDGRPTAKGLYIHGGRKTVIK